ncbi:Guanine nucleotide exchange factor lte1, partial [Mortierella sp. AD032]
MNMIVHGDGLRTDSQQQQDMQDIHRGVTNALLQSESTSRAFAEGESGCRWNGDETRDDDNILVMPDMIPDNHPSIFDDILSDDNEAYIIWSTPSSSGKKQTPPLSTSLAGPLSSRGQTTVSALPDTVNKHPAGSDAPTASATHHLQHHQPTSSLDNKGTTSAGQDRSSTKRWSTIEPLTTRIKENNRSTDSLHSFSPSKPVKQEGNSTGSNLRPPKTPTTTMPATTTTTATEQQQKNRVIMAATVEKLVEKLTSEIDYTFLTDFFLIYRLFITPMALLKLIIVRFHWALVDDSPQRQIVRIRTFVTLRHWLLNYFEFDFMRSKDLRQTLGLYLRSLTKHPRVTNSMREQRIVKELRRYVQSLKTIHYRKLAQQKLEKQSRKQQVERRRRLQARRPSLGRRGSFSDRPISGIVLHRGQGQSSSNRASFVFGTPTDRMSGESEALTEVLTVDFRSSEQSDDFDDLDEDDFDDDEEFYDDGNEEDGDFYNDKDEEHNDRLYSGSGDSTEDEDDDDDDDGFGSLSENSLYESEYNSEYSDSAEDDDEEEDYPAEDGNPDQSQQHQSAIESVVSKKDAEVEGLAVSTALEDDLQPECHLPSPAFSPRSGKINHGGSGSFSSRLAPSAGSSAASRVRARGTRPGLPDFQAGYNAATITNSKASAPSPLHQTSALGAGSRRSSRAKTHSRPLSTFQPLLSPSLSAPPLSPRGSLRSVEPYMNPPPRSVASIEKKKPWAKYMSATVGRLSKMKRVFTSNANKNDGRSEEGSGTRSNNTSGLGRTTRSERYWRGNMSDPEGEKVSYLLACPGMNIIFSSAEDRQGAFGRGGGAEAKRGGGNGGGLGGRGLAKEDGRSGWSSEGDYSQYELTRQRNHEMLSNDGREDEITVRRNVASEPQHHQLHHHHHGNLHQHSEATPEQASTPVTERAHFDFDIQEMESFDHQEEDCKSVCSECEREQYFSRSAEMQRPISVTVDTPEPDEEYQLGGGEGGAHTDEAEELNEMCQCQGECECLHGTTHGLDDAGDLITTTAGKSTGAGRVPNLRRTTQRRQRQPRDQRASWMTLSSTTSSMFGPLLNGNHLPPGQAFRQRGALGNVDRFVERFYNAQPGASQQTAGDASVVAEIPLSGHTDNAQKSQTFEPVSIHPFAVDAHSVGPLTPVVASMPALPFNRNNNSLEESSRGAIPSHPLSNKTSKSTLSPGRSNSQPNLLSSFSDTDVGTPTSSVVVTPWNRQENHSHPHTPDQHCRHNHQHQQHRFSQSPSQISRVGPGGGYRNLSYDHSSTRRGSVDPPSVTMTTKSYSTSSRYDRAPHPRPSPSQKQQQQYQQPRLKIQVGPRLKALSAPSQDSISIVLQYSSELIAQQLCLIEREMLSQVQWYELVDAGWTKKSAPTPSPSSKASSAASSHKEAASRKSHRSSVASSIQINEVGLTVIAGQEGSGAGGVGVGGGVNTRSDGTVTPTPRTGAAPIRSPSAEQHQHQQHQQQQRTKVEEENSLGIKRLVDRFNLTCQWVTSEIVRTKDLNQRVKVVEKFIRIAHTCYNHSNFSSLIQLMLGLQSHNVSRLNQTWARVRSQEMRIMEGLVEYTSPFHNWKHLRDDMKSIADEWGGSGAGGAGAGAGAGATTTAAAVAAAPTEKVAPNSGGTTASSFFGKK